MATYNGSGLFVKIQSGQLQFGKDSTLYARSYASSTSRNGYTYYGFTDNTANFLSLSNLSDFTISGYKGYSGTVRMYTSITFPSWSVIIFDLELEDVQAISYSYQTYRFVNGFMVTTV